jgi:adenylosuccinate synthase
MKKRLLADVIVGLNFGDEGKGKITHDLLQSSEYTHCVRFGGGHNAGFLTTYSYKGELYEKWHLSNKKYNK